MNTLVIDTGLSIVGIYSVETGEYMANRGSRIGNRNLFFECKSRLLKEGKITRSNGKYYRAIVEAPIVH
jgi:hypothetical protein